MRRRLLRNSIRAQRGFSRVAKVVPATWADKQPGLPKLLGASQNMRVGSTNFGVHAGGGSSVQDPHKVDDGGGEISPEFEIGGRAQIWTRSCAQSLDLSENRKPASPGATESRSVA